MPEQQTDHNDQLYVVYMVNRLLHIQYFDTVPVEERDPQRDMADCPPQAYAFVYATGPQQVEKWSQLRLLSGHYFVDAIVIPTARLEEYCRRTRAYHDPAELLRNGGGATQHAHTATADLSRLTLPRTS